jgi:hypothetical protein
VVVAAVVVIAAAVVVTVTRPWRGSSMTVSVGGGTVRSVDDQISVSFKPGQLTAKTTVTFDEQAAAPATPVPAGHR